MICMVPSCPGLKCTGRDDPLCGVTMHKKDSRVIYSGKLGNYLRQQHQAAAMVGTLLHYAIEIGCTVEHDEIICHTADQSALLDAKWKEITK